MPFSPSRFALALGSLVAVSLHAQVTAVSNLAQTVSTTHTVGDSGGNNFRDAISFTTGASITELTSISVFGFGVGSITNFSVSLYSGIASPGGPTGLVAATTGPAVPSALANYNYAPTATTFLAANSTYWLVVAAPFTPSGTFFAWKATASTSEDSGAFAGWSVGDLRWASLNGGSTWSGLGGVIPEFSVQVSAVPEPATNALLRGVALLGFVAWRRRKSTSAC